MNSSIPFNNLFYRNGTFDRTLFNLDYSLRGTLASGESITVATSAVAAGFTGSVFVITAQYDVPFCPGGDCGVGWSTVLTQSDILYPAASSFDTYAIPAVGHCWNFHYGAIANFAVVHTWLALNGF